MKKYIFLWTSLLLLLIASCTEDKGNYTYSEVNKIQIDSIKTYRITQFDTLTIEPYISQTLGTDESNLEYLWYWFPSGEMRMQIDTIGHEKTLKHYAAAQPGVYETRLKVTDKTTGVYSRKDFQVTIEADNSGFLVLSEIEGKANLAIINMANKCFQDVYYAANNEFAGSNPVGIADVDNQRKYIHDIVILCKDENGGVIVDPDNFKKKGSFSDMFFVSPKTINPNSYVSVFAEYSSGNRITYDFIINDGRLYNKDYSDVDWGTILKYRPEILGDYELSPHAFLYENSLIFYDNKNYCFRVLNCAREEISTNKFSPAPLPEGTDISTLPFDPNNVGLELVYGAEGWKKKSYLAGYGYGIFKVPGSQQASDYYCLKFNIGRKVSYTPPYGEYLTPFAKHQITDAPNIEKATSFIMSKADPYLYYSYENKIYSYDLEYDKSKVIYDADTTAVGPGSKIDHLYLRPGKDYRYSLKLWAGSSKADGSKKNGSLHLLNLGRNGDVMSIDTIYQNICGKVIGLAYKRR